MAWSIMVDLERLEPSRHGKVVPGADFKGPWLAAIRREDGFETELS